MNLSRTGRIILSGIMLGLVSACGGGSSPPVTFAPQAPPPPPPPPAPPPEPPSPFNTAEFRQNFGLANINALDAYDAGLTGEGAIVAVIDSGIDTDHLDLEANIHPASTDILGRNGGSPEDGDPGGHGTNVAGVIAATKNDVGMHGVAFNAQVLAIRADDGSTCVDDECSFFDSDTSAGIDHAIANGAHIINLSLGGDDGPSFVLRAAIQRAVDAGILVIISAGNDGDPDPDPLAQFALNPGVLGGVLIAGASTDDNNLAGFSNKAGVASEVYIAAPGQFVRTTTIDDGYETVSGTSFSAPHVAGAAALLVELFPNLTGREIAEILLDTAFDLGVAGPDTIFGRGLLDLAAAVSAQGPASVPTRVGQSAPPTVSDSGMSVGPAFGTSFGTGLSFADIVFLDKYDRTYRTDLSDRLIAPPSRVSLDSFLDQRRRYDLVDVPLPGDRRLGFSTMDPRSDIQEIGYALSESARSTARREVPSASFTSALGSKTEIRIAHGLTLDTLIRGDDARADRIAGFVSGHNLRNPYFGFSEDQKSAALSRHMGEKTSLSFGVQRAVAEFGRDDDFPGIEGRTVTTAMALRAERTLRAGTIGLTLGAIDEAGAVLETVSSGVFELGEGAVTRFAGFDGALRLAEGWMLGARYTHGVTSVAPSQISVFEDVSRLTSQAFSATLTGRSVFRRGDSLGIAFAQPLRVTSGAATVTLPTGRDFVRDEILYDITRTALQPDGRELDLEVHYRFHAFDWMAIEANILHRFSPGHESRAPNATSLLLRASGRF